eukprot:5333408-Amphidinium_carterae.1
MLPESFLSNVTVFRISNNRFAGALPDGGMRGMLAMTYFEMETNRITGTLPDGGIRAMMAVTLFSVFENRLEGMLPSSGMTLVARFYIDSNCFTGALPAHMLIRMKKVHTLWIESNRFAG